MKPDYKNWIPKGMLFSLIAGTMLSLALLLVFGVFGIGVGGKLRIVLGAVFGIAFVVCAKYTQWCVYAYRSFSYNGERKLSKQIIEGTAGHIILPEGGVGLDVGCGSGALTIACAKRSPQGKMVGIDRWGKEYASFSLPLCEKNAAAGSVKNASFQRGNAVKLDFPDESFDAVTSNYVYHNIAGKDKQALLLETLRVLKKGGTFAIHDLMSPRRYGDKQALVQKLRGMGYERVELIDTTTGKFMTPKEAGRLLLGLIWVQKSLVFQGFLHLKSVTPMPAFGAAVRLPSTVSAWRRRPDNNADSSPSTQTPDGTAHSACRRSASLSRRAALRPLGARHS